MRLERLAFTQNRKTSCREFSGRCAQSEHGKSQPQSTVFPFRGVGWLTCSHLFFHRVVTEGQSRARRGPGRGRGSGG